MPRPQLVPIPVVGAAVKAAREALMEAEHAAKTAVAAYDEAVASGAAGVDQKKAAMIAAKQGLSYARGARKKAEKALEDAKAAAAEQDKLAAEKANNTQEERKPAEGYLKRYRAVVAEHCSFFVPEMVASFLVGLHLLYIVSKIKISKIKIAVYIDVHHVADWDCATQKPIPCMSAHMMCVIRLLRSMGIHVHILSYVQTSKTKNSVYAFFDETAKQHPDFDTLVPPCRRHVVGDETKGEAPNCKLRVMKILAAKQGYLVSILIDDKAATISVINKANGAVVSEYKITNKKEQQRYPKDAIRNFMPKGGIFVGIVYPFLDTSTTPLNMLPYICAVVASVV